MNSARTIRLGTRASTLARWQADWVAGQLRSAGVDVELVMVSTTGDQKSAQPIEAIGAPGVFTKEIQRALLEQRVDVAVHSLKDLPTDEITGLQLTAVPRRESVRDVLISRDGRTFGQLAEGAVIGTGSLRRRAQLWHTRSDLRMADLRGNVDSRLRKLADGECHAIVLAEAGLERLGLSDRITQVLPESLMLPAAGQGALGIETRSDDSDVTAALALLDDQATHCAVTAERALLQELRGGCLAPVGAWAQIEPDGRLHLAAVVLSADGKRRLAASMASDLNRAPELGRQVAERLRADGADELIATARDS